MTTDKNFVYANDPDSKCSVPACLFANISVKGPNYVLRIARAAEGILSRCCFWGDRFDLIKYESGLDAGWYITFGSVNSTSCVNCQSETDLGFGRSEEFTFFLNNYTNLSTSK